MSGKMYLMFCYTKKPLNLDLEEKKKALDDDLLILGFQPDPRRPLTDLPIEQTLYIYECSIEDVSVFNHLTKSLDRLFYKKVKENNVSISVKYICADIGRTWSEFSG